jgi:4-hydroxy-tetrahydrodipicolinate synthase
MTPKELHGKIKGILHLIMTPFTADDKLDEAALRSGLRHAINRAKGKDFVFLAGGSTAEFYALTDAEVKQYMEIVVDEVKGEFPVIMGASKAGTKATLELCQHAEKTGADGVMIVTPFYAPCTEDNLYKHFEIIAKNIGIGIVLYNNPATTKHWMPPQLIARLSKISNIVGNKENISNPMSFYRIQKAVSPEDMVVFTGLGYEEYQYLALSPLGCPAYVSELVNLVPKITFGIYEAGKARDHQKMGYLVEGLEPYRIFCDELAAKRKLPLSVGPFIAGPLMTIYQAVIKEAMTILGVPTGKVRGPVDNLTPQEIKDLEAVVKKMKDFEDKL